MKIQRFLIVAIVVASIISIIPISHAFEYSWQLDETPEGQESVTPISPIEIIFVGEEPIEIPTHDAAFHLMRKYSVLVNAEWTAREAAQLLKIFDSIPQRHYSYSDTTPLSERDLIPSTWQISDLHIHNDISIEYQNEMKIITVSRDAFTYATPLLVKIEGVRGRYYSKRLHRAVVRFVTDNGANRHALEQILQIRYAVSVNIPDYTELTRNTTKEHSGRFQDFKNEELIYIASMFEEYPTGMHKTPGLKYLVRRLDGTVNPVIPKAIGLAWIGAGYIEFMEGAFNRDSISEIYRTIIHEKSHFLWAHLFGKRLKQDWIDVGGWYENPDDPDGWSTTQEVEFVTYYAHKKNPDEDMAESISFYITNPDKLRARAPAKYEFIQNRVMHGTRYISRIREDLTFEVYNLYPDYIYPGRIKRIDIRVEGAPKEDKQITIDIALHTEGGLDTASSAYVHIYSEKGTDTALYLYPIDSNGTRVSESSNLRGTFTLSKYAASGYWTPNQIGITDTVGNRRWQDVDNFGWKLYIDNPMTDDKSPEYVKDSIQLSLSDGTTRNGRSYQFLTVTWQVIEKNELYIVHAFVNDNNPKTYSHNLRYSFNYGRAQSYIKDFSAPISQVSASLNIPDYFPTGKYKVSQIKMEDTAGNVRRVIFTEPPEQGLHETERVADELPPTIEIHTKNPDTTTPMLDLNNITIKAEPTQPEKPNGETIVDMTFRIKDDNSGFRYGQGRVRSPFGDYFHFHVVPERNKYDSGIYFIGDPNAYVTYDARVLLPAGSHPGIWGLTYLGLRDAAGNFRHYDFTEIIRFEVEDVSIYAKYDLNKDDEINILDLVIVANAFEEYNANADVNGDEVVNILDLVLVASAFGNGDIAAPSLHKDELQDWLTLALASDNGSYQYRQGLNVLQQLLRTTHPEKTVLLPNYPNPFNPETWIPYELAEPVNVVVTIYDIGGHVVRKLDLGYQNTGRYVKRNRAAYWDGKNSLGEPVSSGFYFYTLTAGKYVATRRLLILK